MPTEKITKQAVERLDPGAVDGYLWDSEQKGFGVKVTPNGFDDCQSEWRISVEPKLRDQTRQVVFYYAAHARFLPTLSSKVRKRDLLRLAKHAREADSGISPNVFLSYRNWQRS
jgi:hypothetical protein